MPEKKIYTVSAVNHIISSMFSDEDFFSSLAVTGEVSNVVYHRSGHIYFSVKDASSVLPAVMFRSAASGLKFKMNDGDQVVIYGSIGVYEQGGRYQLYARRIERAGVGDLYQRFEELKKSLSEEGMFDEAYKQPIPPYGLNIGVVTAPTGAVIHDIIRNARRRNPHVSITLCPVKVQGEGAAEEIATGLARMDTMGFDTIIVGRGGGSIEDLWAFNEEVVARQIFASRTPVISGVGHEPDVTIADFVADKRASTPTAAAELAVFSYDEFASGLNEKKQQMAHAFYLKAERVKREIERDRGMLARLSPEARVRSLYQRLSEKADALDQAMQVKISAAREKLPRQAVYTSCMERALSAVRGRIPRQAVFNSAIDTRLSNVRARVKLAEGRPAELMEKRLLERKNSLGRTAAVLDGLSPLKKLASGYSYVTDEAGHNVKSVTGLSEGDLLSVRLSDGSVKTRVEEIG